jgi:LPS-assembly lipoprotein
MPLHLKQAWRCAALAALLMLGACGFHLAGTRPLPAPLADVYIDMVSPYTVTEPPLQAALQSRIESRGGQVKSKMDQAKTVLRLSDLSETREVLSVGPDGKAVEYRLVTRVTYELRSGERVLIAPESQGMSRDYSFSAQQILPKEAEEVRLRKFIQGELAELILLRIEAELSRVS